MSLDIIRQTTVYRLWRPLIHYFVKLDSNSNCLHWIIPSNDRSVNDFLYSSFSPPRIEKSDSTVTVFGNTVAIPPQKSLRTSNFFPSTIDSIICETLSSSLHSPFVYGLVVAQLFLRVQKMSRIDSGLSRLWEFFDHVEWFQDQIWGHVVLERPGYRGTLAWRIAAWRTTAALVWTCHCWWMKPCPWSSRSSMRRT